MIFLREIASRKIFLGAYLALKFQKKHKNEIIRRKIRAKNTRRYEKHARKKNQKKFHRSLRIRRSGVRVPSGAPRSLAFASDLFCLLASFFMREGDTVLHHAVSDTYHGRQTVFGIFSLVPSSFRVYSFPFIVSFPLQIKCPGSRKLPGPYLLYTICVCSRPCQSPLRPRRASRPVPPPGKHPRSGAGPPPGGPCFLWGAASARRSAQVWPWLPGRAGHSDW